MDDGLIGPGKSSYIQHQIQVMKSAEFVYMNMNSLPWCESQPRDDVKE